MTISPNLKRSIASRAAPFADDQRHERIVAELLSDLADPIADVDSWADELSKLKPVTESVLASASNLYTDLHALQDKLDADKVDGDEIEALRTLKGRYEALKPLVEVERQRDVGFLSA